MKGLKAAIFSFLLILNSLAGEESEPKKGEQKPVEQRKGGNPSIIPPSSRGALEKYFQKDFLDRVDSLFQNSMADLEDEDDIFKHFEERMKELEKGGFALPPTFNHRFRGMENSTTGDEWKETKEGMVYLMEGNLEDGLEFDVNVKDSQVTISGEVAQSLEGGGNFLRRFKKSFPVPQGTDHKKIKIDQGKEGIEILFPWSQERPKKKDSSAIKAPPKNRPVPPSQDDLKI